jgi:hypothetical protein
MHKLIRTLRKPINLWIALALLVANGLAWATALASGGPAYVAEPILAPSLDDLRTRLIEGGHSGERFEVHVTDREAADSIAWFLDKRPEVPFRHPRIAFHSNGLDAWGEVDILGLKLSIHGWATMVLENGIPIVTLTDLEVAGAPVPGFVLEAIQNAVYEQVDLSNRQLPIVFETLELREGEVIAGGTIR